MTDLSTLRIDQPQQVVSSIVQLLSGSAVQWWQTNSAAVEEDLRTLAQSAAQTAAALAEGIITPATAKMAFDAQKQVLAETPCFVEFMAAAEAQSLFDGIFSILGGAIKNVVGFDPFTAVGD